MPQRNLTVRTRDGLHLAGILADISGALGVIRGETDAGRVSLLDASFSGGVCGYYAAEQQGALASLVMFNSFCQSSSSPRGVLRNGVMIPVPR